MYTTIALAVCLGGWPHSYDCGSEPCGTYYGCCLHSHCILRPDMPPHIPYQPCYHGHYYFRPYQYLDVLSQRQAAERLGEDPRNPYANRIFEQIYKSVESQQGETKQ